MAKKLNKLALVKASGLATIIGAQLPTGKGIKKLNLPPLVKFGNKPNEIGVGITVSGVLIGLVDNFTGQEQMKGSKTIHLRHESGEEFLLPLTGALKSTFKMISNSDGTEIKPEYINKTFFFTRKADGVAKKYGGKQMFQVDVNVIDE